MRLIFVIALAFVLPELAQAKGLCPGTIYFNDMGHKQDELLGKLRSQDSLVNVNVETHARPKGVRVTTTFGTSIDGELSEGDVILKVNGQPITTKRAFDARVAGLKAGTVLRMVVLSEGKQEERKVTVRSRDPVLGALMRHAARIGCQPLYARDDPAADEGVFNQEDATLKCGPHHEYLSPTPYPSIIMARDSKRIMLSFPPMRTICIDGASWDGKTLTRANVAALFTLLTAGAKTVKQR